MSNFKIKNSKIFQEYFILINHVRGNVGVLINTGEPRSIYFYFVLH
jgi:hypothetical protein